MGRPGTKTITITLPSEKAEAFERWCDERGLSRAAGCVYGMEQGGGPEPGAPALQPDEMVIRIPGAFRAKAHEMGVQVDVLATAALQHWVDMKR